MVDQNAPVQLTILQFKVYKAKFEELSSLYIIDNIPAYIALTYSSSDKPSVVVKNIVF